MDLRDHHHHPLPFCNMKKPESPNVDLLEPCGPSTTVRDALEATANGKHFIVDCITPPTKIQLTWLKQCQRLKQVAQQRRPNLDTIKSHVLEPGDTSLRESPADTRRRACALNPGVPAAISCAEQFLVVTAKNSVQEANRPGRVAMSDLLHAQWHQISCVDGTRRG